MDVSVFCRQILVSISQFSDFLVQGGSTLPPFAIPHRKRRGRRTRPDFEPPSTALRTRGMFPPKLRGGRAFGSLRNLLMPRRRRRARHPGPANGERRRAPPAPPAPPPSAPPPTAGRRALLRCGRGFATCNKHDTRPQLRRSGTGSPSRAEISLSLSLSLHPVQLS